MTGKKSQKKVGGSVFALYTPTSKYPKMLKNHPKCRENIQRVTEHPFFHLVKKSWSYHEYRAFYDKKMQKIHFFRGLGGFEPDLRFRFSHCKIREVLTFTRIFNAEFDHFIHIFTRSYQKYDHFTIEILNNVQ